VQSEFVTDDASRERESLPLCLDQELFIAASVDTQKRQLIDTLNPAIN
jgi:hypothetical protein